MRFLLSCCWLLLATAISAQNLYWIRLKDKGAATTTNIQAAQVLSPKAIARRAKHQVNSLRREDLPVWPAYIDSLRTAGEVLYTSRWQNAALIRTTTASYNRLLSASYVLPTGSRQVQRSANTGGRTSATHELAYGGSSDQINQLDVDDMHRLGVTGRGVTVAVFDSGFDRLPTLRGFDSLTQRGRILSTYDFVDRETDVYDDNDHGTVVLSAMAAYLPDQLIGPAYRADYHLFRTEKSGSENLVEEIYWLIAAERADSLGVDMIQSSLGYNTFDDPSQDHTLSELDGRTTIVSRAARYAASVGILVVVSAGNEGNNANWGGRITAPADVDSVLSVGAVNAQGAYASFSSRGPTADGRIKPDVVARGQGAWALMANGLLSSVNGTSLATPLVSGLAAGLMEMYPQMTCWEIMRQIRESGHQSTTPDNRLGYGIPSFRRIYLRVTSSDPLTAGLSAGPLFPNPSTTGIGLIRLTTTEHEAIQWEVHTLTGQAVPHQIRLMDDYWELHVEALHPQMLLVTAKKDGHVWLRYHWLIQP